MNLMGELKQKELLLNLLPPEPIEAAEDLAQGSYLAEGFLALLS